MKTARVSIFIPLALMLLTALPATSQPSDFGNWFQYFGNAQINSSWNWHNEVQYRNYNFVGDLEQLLLRTGVGYNLSENNNNLLVGYGYILSENYLENGEKEQVNEHRTFLQFINRHNIKIVYFQHRIRYEQRWIESDFKMRFRYFIGVNIPLGKQEMTNNTYYFSAYNEIFLNLEEDVFDRNRLYGALGCKFSKVIRIEVGYLNQFLQNGGRDQLNLAAFVSF